MMVNRNKSQIFISSILFLFSLVISGCDAEETSLLPSPFFDVIEQTQSVKDSGHSDGQGIMPTMTPIPQEENRLKIISLKLQYGTLCPGAQSLVHFSISNPANYPLSIRWNVEFGNISESGDETIYTAPDEIPADRFDVIEMTLTDGVTTLQESMIVMIINKDDTTPWENTAGPYGGNVSSIAISNTNPDLLYAGAGDRVYKSIDGGESWIAGEPLNNPGGSAIQIFLNQNDPDIIYALKGKLYKSTNGGNSFNQVLNVPTHISVAGMSPFNPDFLVAGTGGSRAFMSTNGGRNWTQLNFPKISSVWISAIGIASDTEIWIGTREWSGDKDGQLYHSTDQGSSWEIIDNIDRLSDTYIQSILVDPVSPQDVYISFSQSDNAGFSDPTRVLFWSSNNGEAWKSIHLPRVWDSTVFTLGLSEYNRNLYINHANVLYILTKNGDLIKQINIPKTSGETESIAIDSRNANVFYLPERYGRGIIKTTNGGETFTWMNNGILNTSMSLLASGSRIGNGTVYATSSGGEGLFRSYNYGENWVNITDNGITHFWGDEIQLNPHDPDEIWYIADLGRTQVSRDQGEHWETIFHEWDEGFKYSSVYALASSPANPDILYSLKNGVGIFKHEDWRLHPSDPIFLRSSEVDYSLSIAVHPLDERILVSGYIPKPFQDFAFVRASWDGGENWETIHEIKGSDGFTSVAFSPVMPDRLYFGSIGPGSAVFRSDNLEEGFQKLPAPWGSMDLAETEIKYIEIVPHPSLPDTVYISAYPIGVFMSEDAGETWISKGNGLPKFYVQDPLRKGRHNLAISISEPNTLFVGIYGEGVYKSIDSGNSWLTTSSLPETGILALTIDPTDPNIVYVGTNNGVYRTENGGENWSPMPGIQGIQVRVFVWSGNSDLIAGTLGYELYYYRRGGEEWSQKIGLGRFGVTWPIWNDRPLYQYTSLAFHPEDPNRIILGTFPAGIYTSNDNGISWQESNVEWTWDGVFTLAFHPENADILFAGTYNGVNRSIDGGESWEMWDTGWPDEQWVFSISFDPRDPDIMYACSKNGENEGRGQPGFFMGTVMKSTDGGETWFRITRGLPRDQEYYKIIVDPFTPDVLYLASSREGVYISYDEGQSRQKWNEGLTNKTAGTNGNNVTNTMTLSPDGLHLYFGTAGSGVFRRLTVNAPGLCGCDQ